MVFSLPRRLVMVAVLALAPLAAIARPAALPDSAEQAQAEAAIRSHVAYLASDALKGREAGTPEFDLAAQYVAAQFAAAGLKPGGDAGGYLQRVPLVTYQLAGAPSAAIGGHALELGRDWAPLANPAATATRIAAPVVFVGYGVVAPAYDEDDYAGVDVRGKVVAVVPGSPAGVTPEERAFFGAAATKSTLAAAHGAVGVIELTVADTPQPRAAKPHGYVAPRPKTTWWTGTAGFAEGAAAPMLGTLTRDASAKLFAGVDDLWRDVLDAARDAEPEYRSFALPTTLTLASATTFASLPSSNVIGVLPGGDPAAAKEVVVLSAHLDHIGVSALDPAKPDADRINNGALDDAIGIASLIEEAKRLASDQKRPRRTIMFLAVTAEEKGLVGSSYFTHYPTVPIRSFVADVNLDMPILFYPFRDLVAFGGDRSTLGPIIARAAGEIGVTMAPDPIPEQGIFVRSDHFNFVREGVPSIFLWPGPANGGAAATRAFLAGCYHHPCDDLSQPILWDQAVRFVDVNYRIARAIADAKDAPRWNEGDYFGLTFKGPGA